MNQPIKLPANQPPQFYRGGDAIAELRGASASESRGTPAPDRLGHAQKASHAPASNRERLSFGGNGAYTTDHGRRAAAP